MIFLDGVVGKMHKFVIDVVKTVLIAAKSKIAFLIKPYDWRIEIFDKNPLSYIEFFTIY